MCIHVYFAGLRQKRWCKQKNAGFYTWIMAIRVSYFRSGYVCEFAKVFIGSMMIWSRVKSYFAWESCPVKEKSEIHHYKMFIWSELFIHVDQFKHNWMFQHHSISISRTVLFFSIKPFEICQIFSTPDFMTLSEHNRSLQFWQSFFIYLCMIEDFNAYIIRIHTQKDF